MKPSDKETPKLRLQVFLSRNGVCSRRKALDHVLEGRVRVNGRIIKEPSTSIDPQGDKISFDDQLVRPKEYEYILFNKPEGFVTTKSDPHAEDKIYDLLPQEYQHLACVGRLDKQTEGLLLLTNDGDLIHRLLHPRFHVEKKYYALIRGRLLMPDRKQLEKGVYLQGRKTAPAQISILESTNKKTILHITIHEGRKRQVRLMFAKLGHKVMYLKRIAMGNLLLGNLKIGRWRKVKGSEIFKLMETKRAA